MLFNRNPHTMALCFILLISIPALLLQISARYQISVFSLQSRSLRGGSGGKSGGGWHSNSGTYTNNYGRGGSGGRSGGGGWHSNSGGRSNNRWNNRNRTRNGGGMSTFGKVMTGLAIGALGLGLMALFFPALGMGMMGCCPCLMGLCCGLGAAGAAAGAMKQGQQGGASSYFLGGDSSRDDNIFEEQVQRAKMEVDTERSMNLQQQMIAVPYSGEYTTYYIDGGTSHNATLSLTFTDIGTGFKISGGGQDIDGTTVIEDGHANYDGTAWWRERTIEGDVGLQVLSRGQFHFTHRTFQGTWFASSMQSGSYLSFRATDNSGYVPMMNSGMPPVQPMAPVVQAQVVPSGSAPPYNPPTVIAQPINKNAY